MLTLSVSVFTWLAWCVTVLTLSSLFVTLFGKKHFLGMKHSGNTSWLCILRKWLYIHLHSATFFIINPRQQDFLQICCFNWFLIFSSFCFVVVCVLFIEWHWQGKCTYSCMAAYTWILSSLAPLSASNGNPRLPDSLHYNDPSGRPNAYQRVRTSALLWIIYLSVERTFRCDYLLICWDLKEPI